MSANQTPIHEITWTVEHKHFLRLTQADFDMLAERLYLHADATNTEVIDALYESRRAEEVLAELASDRNWLDSDAEMVLDNVYREANS